MSSFPDCKHFCLILTWSINSGIAIFLHCGSLEITITVPMRNWRINPPPPTGSQEIDPANINQQHSLSEEVSNLSLQVIYIKGQGCLFSRKINFPFPFPFLKINDFRGNNKNKNKHFYVHFLQYLDGGSF